MRHYNKRKEYEKFLRYLISVAQKQVKEKPTEENIEKLKELQLDMKLYA